MKFHLWPIIEAASIYAINLYLGVALCLVAVLGAVLLVAAWLVGLVVRFVRGKGRLNRHEARRRLLRWD